MARAQIKKKSETLGKFHQENNTASKQSATWKTSQTKTTTRTFEIQWEDTTSISTEAEVSINLPMLGGGEVGLEAAQTTCIGSRRAEETGLVDRFEFDLPGIVEPMSELTIELKAERCEIFVPVSATLRKDARVWKVDGIYKGIQYVNANVTYV